MIHEFPSAKAALAKDPKGGEANCKMAWALAIQKKQADAERYLANAKKAGYKGPYLAKAYNMIGDLYQTGNQFDVALGYFQRADAATTDVKDRSYAKVSIMSCYVQSGQRDKAKAAAQELIDLKGATKEYVDFAKQVLAQGDGGA